MSLLLSSKLCPNHAKNSVMYESIHYAALDMTPPSQPFSGTQNRYLGLPDGWTFAPREPAIVQNVIAKYPWGTDVMLVVDGCYCTACQEWMTAGQEFPGMKLRSRVEHGQTQYKPSMDNARILIRYKGMPSWCPPVQTASLGRQLLEDKQFADCDIVCGEEVIPCHRSVLAVASPVFRQMLASEMREGREKRIEVSDASSHSVRAMIKFMYTEEIESEIDDIFQVLRLADKYQIPRLGLACYPKLFERLSVENVAAAVRALKHFADERPGKDMWNHFCEHLKANDELFRAALQAM
eukprot:gnl/TRDRNA2_/TRDRNA2_203109_c0_seq1.p1 gnl/TRDRNA2_/TRDRNA2_203109_c0~~gnl/TRDRNA2_/TRDRNA2_203109_c0_seq1.p1  ORF type:complete len:295 (-),score=33.57 gnl/TRDRNA2_/TRDRNA2_203109_c0_seq1:73-957(-)